jgi:hypothetical protein
MQLINFTVEPTVGLPLGTFPAGLQIGFWDLGEGELDGTDALWINNVLQFAYDPQGNLMGSSLLGVVPSNTTTTPTLSSYAFYTGYDVPVGTTQLDTMWSHIGSLATGLSYSRRSYYVIGWTPGTTAGGTLAPVADFRGMRCRIFDGAGNQVGYRFTTNPIWHFVDLWLRRAIKPEYAIDPYLGPTQLTAAEQSKFNWPSIYAAAQYCDYILPNGQPRFTGSYVFTGGTLQAMLEQVLLCCRGYMYEYAGQIYVYIDQPRASSFIVNSTHVVPGSFACDNSQVNQNANRYIAQFLELGLPAVATIATVTRTATQVAIHTVNPNPCAPNDVISVGGVADASFNHSYQVATTPSSTEVDCAIVSGLAGSSTGGYIGYLQSRFSTRTPEISHLQHQQAQGQILPPSTTGSRLKRIMVNYNFASMTYDQANRLLKYEVYRDLGIDYLNPILLTQLFGNTALLGSPYLPPFGITIGLFAESVDVNSQALKAQLQGSILTLDSSVFYEFAGQYEIMERTFNPIQQEIEDSTSGGFVQAVTRSGALSSGSDSNSGVLTLVLRSYNPNVFFDVSDAPNSSFATVPGTLPYAGLSAGGSGYVIEGGVLTLESFYVGSGGLYYAGVNYSYPSLTLLFAGGTTLSIPAGGYAFEAATSGPFWFVMPPSMAGIIVTSPPAPSPGTYILAGPFYILPPPTSGGSGGPYNTTTIPLS